MTKPLKVYNVDLMVDNAQLGFSVSVQDHKLMVYLYLLKAKESSGGICLLQWADVHVGTQVNMIWRTPGGGSPRGPAKSQ